MRVFKLLFSKSSNVLLAFKLNQKILNCLAVLLDAGAVILAWYGAFWVTSNIHQVPTVFQSIMQISLLFVVALQIGFNFYFGLYRVIWRYISILDIVRIVKSIVLGSVTSIFALIMIYQSLYISRSVVVLYPAFLLMLLCMSRLGIRCFIEYRHRMQGNLRTLIIGAGQAGEWLARDLNRSTSTQLLPVAFIDDSGDKQGREIHGIRVVGKTSDIAVIVDNLDINLIIIAIPSICTQDMRRIVELCEATELPVRTLPSVVDLAQGHVIVNSLREVRLPDLIGREVCEIDSYGVKHCIENQVILVTGGAGSIGAELCRQILSYQPKKIIIFEISEYALYQLKNELQASFANIEKQFLLVNISDKNEVNRQLQIQQPTVVFHAAAYKHVPMLESQVLIAIKNNIFGTRVMAEAAHALGIKKFILVSTDKAVNPSNIMGLSKRVGELICQNLNDISQTQFITVRFGNVLGSNGSIVPLFKKQIAQGGPVTVTHPEITRYFMTIPEAAQLILQATLIGKGGEIFVLEMGERVSIVYLAKQMIRLAGKRPDEDIKIEYVGLRPGEKLHEELFHEGEELSVTSHKMIMQAHSRKVDFSWLMEILDEMLGLLTVGDEADLLKKVLTLVPEYTGKNPQPTPTCSLRGVNDGETHKS